MINIKELAEQTGLKPAFIGKCYRDLKDSVLAPPMTGKGESNSTWFSSNAIVYFEKISKEKDKGLNWPTIKKRLFSDFELQGENQKNQSSKPAEEQKEKAGKVASDKEIDIISELQNQIRETERAKHEVEKEKLNAESDLKEIKAAMGAYLPDGGDATDLHKRFNEYNRNMSQIQILIEQLEKTTTSHWLWKHSSEVAENWENVKRLIKECLRG